MSFCHQASLPSFPAAERTLCLFVGHLFKDGVSSQTVKLYLAAVRHAQIACGGVDPRLASMPQLEYVVKGFKKAMVNKARPRLPITPQIIESLQTQWEKLPEQGDASMLWAAACMCLFSFLRCGEVVIPSDSTFDAETHLA